LAVLPKRQAMRMTLQHMWALYVMHCHWYVLLWDQQMFYVSSAHRRLVSATYLVFICLKFKIPWCIVIAMLHCFKLWHCAVCLRKWHKIIVDAISLNFLP